MSQIKVTIIKDSIAVNTKRITTFELEYPRFIHSEVMTHRVFSRNAASSRAIPIWKVIKQVITDPAMPIHWGKNKRGMQADSELSYVLKMLTKGAWILSSWFAVLFALLFKGIGLHKQVGNRILEPYQRIKVVLTSTEFDNFFKLRKHPDAQPEIYALACEMYAAMENSKPKLLKEGQYHLPYVDTYTNKDNPLGYCVYKETGDHLPLTLKEAIMVSASCCAQVSYRVLDNSLDKALLVFDRLYNAKPFHASPFEHQATPAKSINYKSGNLQGWKQLRSNMSMFEEQK